MTEKKTEPNGFNQLTDTGKFKVLYEQMKMKPPKTKDPSTPYLTAVMFSLIIGITGVASITYFRPDFDVLVVSGVIFAFLTPTTTSLLALLKTQETNEVAKETHLSVNSRLDAFVETAAIAAHAAGVQVGEAKANERTDILTAQKESAKATTPTP